MGKDYKVQRGMQTPKPLSITEDFEVRDRILLDMRDRIGVDTKREGVHLSSLVFCMRKGWHMYRIDQSEKGRAATLGETPDETALVWVIGHSHEAIFGANSIRGESTDKDGITFTPDFWMPKYSPDADPHAFTLVEMKSTRKSSRKTIEDMPHYIAQVAGYCAANKHTECLIFILHIMGDYGHDHPPNAVLRVWRLKFSKKELADWWKELRYRRELILGEFEPDLSDLSPVHDWECGYCQVRELINCPGCEAYQKEQERAADRESKRKLVQPL